jgi:translation initiation factor IF-2
VSNSVRVHQLAKEVGLENREVIRRLTELGIEAKSHSSTVSTVDAKRLKDTLGRSEEERRREEDERRRREEAELERYRKLDQSPVAKKKAAKVLPPHLRKAQEEAEAAEVAAKAAAHAAEAPGAPVPPASAGTESAAAARSVGDAPTDTPTVAPAAADAPGAADGAGSASDASGDAGAKRMPGAPPPRLRPGDAPIRPPVARTGPTPGPGAPAPGPMAPTEGLTVRRPPRPEAGLPLEGSGRRMIPPPLREARPRPTGAAGGPGGPGGPGAPARGRPGAGAGTGAPSSPYRQSPGRNVPGAALPGRGAPRTGPGGSGGPGAPGAPGRGPGPGLGGPGSGKTKRKKRRDRETPEEQELRGPMRRDIPLAQQVVTDRVEVVSGITVGEFADKLGVAGSALVKKLFEMGEMATVQQTLPDDTIEILCADLGVGVYFLSEEELEFGVEQPDAAELLQTRPPVITVMGHVDHGKTLLLDAIRSTDVVSSEAGGITQHIGAYQVSRAGRAITFIDTPGHEAFTAMRARGAQVTDVAILVVAADDGVKPQTEEAINHAKAAGVPIVVAINKCDLPDADPRRARAQLTQFGLVAEDLGGDVPMVEVSAKTKQGLDDLLEIVLLQADLLELVANPDKDARGRVVEANLDRGRGPVATVLVQAGTLRRGDILVAGTADGRIRAMFDEDGNALDEAGPSRPVQVLGLNEVPEAGDEFRVVDAERLARDVAERRSTRERRKELAERRPTTLEEFTSAVEAGEKATLNVIIKADVSGSAEALEDALLKLELDEVQVRVLQKGVGAISQGDVRLAEASNAIIVAFNVRPGTNVREEINRSGVDVRSYRIIYEAIEDIQLAVRGLLAPEQREQVLGEAEVREIFRVPRIGVVSGCMVTRGVVRREAKVRIVREGIVIGEDSMSSLKRFKDDAREVAQGFECGIGLNNFQDVKVGDVFEAFEIIVVART